MFAPFLTGSEELRVDATLLLIRKHLDDPSNTYRRDLLEFKFKNQLVTPDELEVMLKMAKQMTEKDRAKIKDIFQNHPFGREMAESFAAKAAAEAAAEATAEVKFKTAKAALKKGLSVDDVIDITGLSRETILELNLEILGGK